MHTHKQARWHDEGHVLPGSSARACPAEPDLAKVAWQRESYFLEEILAASHSCSWAHCRMFPFSQPMLLCVPAALSPACPIACSPLMPI